MNPFLSLLCLFAAIKIGVRVQPNIGQTGRILRGLIGLTLLGIALAAWRVHWLACAGLAAGGAFCLFEALRGWCVARACGVKTRW